MENTATYALVDENGHVYNVIVGKDTPGEEVALQQLFPEAVQIVKQTEETGLAVLNGSYAGGQLRDVSPFPSWVWNTETRVWEAPVPVPVDPTQVFSWDEEQGEWVGEPVTFIPPSE